MSTSHPHRPCRLSSSPRLTHHTLGRLPVACFPLAEDVSVVVEVPVVHFMDLGGTWAPPRRLAPPHQRFAGCRGRRLPPCGP